MTTVVWPSVLSSVGGMAVTRPYMDVQKMQINLRATMSTIVDSIFFLLISSVEKNIQKHNISSLYMYNSNWNL